MNCSRSLAHRGSYRSIYQVLVSVITANFAVAQPGLAATHSDETPAAHAATVSLPLHFARPGPVEALRAVGAPWPTIFIKGYWPQVEPAFWAIALFRWDISVRESAVLGLVGAGGIGMAIDTAMNLFQWERVALMLAAIFGVVVVAEIVVTQIRKRII